MDHAIELMQQHVHYLAELVGKQGSDQSKVLAELARAVQSLQELHAAAAEREKWGTLQAERDKLALRVEALEREKLSISAMGTVAGSRGHMIVSAVSAKRELLRRDIKANRHVGLETRGLLEEVRDILEAPTLPTPDHLRAHELPPEAAPITKPVLVNERELQDSLEKHLQAQRKHAR